MKRYAIVLLLCFTTSVFMAFSQDTEKMDNMECLKNYSLYKEALKKKMYDYSIDAWRVMFEECPDVKIQLYSDGVEIYKHYIKQADNDESRQALVDTLLMIYDQRMQYFGDHPKYPSGWVLGRKGLDIVTYRRHQKSSLMEAFDCFEQSFQQLNTRMEPMVAVNWLQATNALVNTNDLDYNKLLSVYFNVDDVLSNHISKQQSQQRVALLKKVSNTCTEILIKSGYDDCGALESALLPKYESYKENQEKLERLLKLMVAFDCTDGELYSMAAEQNYRLNPNAQAAYLLAKYFVRQGKFDKAKEYYLKGISLDPEGELQAQCFYELAVITFSHFNDSREARKYAKDALQARSDWGKPYILIGNIYAQESAKYGDNDFEHQTVYWVAIDQFRKAKAVDPECSLEADKQIKLYTQYLPDKETGFFHGIQEGDSYTVGSWINEKTKVRYR